MNIRDQQMANMPEPDRFQQYGYGLANAASDPEYMARQQELAWQDHLARVEWLRRMAVHSIRNQPFF